MRTTTAAILMMALATGGLAGCGRSAPVEDSAPAAPAKAAAVTAAPAAPAVPPPPPVGSELIDPALAGAQAFNAGSAATLALIARSEGRFQAAAGRAAAAAARGEARGVSAARREADAARAALTQALATFRTEAEAQTAAVAAALAACTETPELAAYPACVALPAEQTLLAANVTAGSQRFEAAEAAYVHDRARLDEAAATIALSAAPR